MRAWRECAIRIEIRRELHDDQHSHQRTPSLTTYQHTIPRSVVILIFFIHYYIMLIQLSVLYFILILMLYLYTYIIRQVSSTSQGTLHLIFSVNTLKQLCHKEHVERQRPMKRKRYIGYNYFFFKVLNHNQYLQPIGTQLNYINLWLGSYRIS